MSDGKFRPSHLVTEEFLQMYPAKTRYTKVEMDKKFPQVNWKGINNLFTEEGEKSIVQLSDGNYYDGSWAKCDGRFIFQGRGIYYVASGSRSGLCYTGEFHLNQFHGQGFSWWTRDSETWKTDLVKAELRKIPPYSYFDGKPFQYLGNFVNGAFDGVAMCNFKDSEIMFDKEVCSSVFSS